jgi:type VI secretion system secreted protein VgrG
MNVENFMTTVITPLGADQLLFSHLSGHEAMGRLFEFELELLRPEQLGSVDSSKLMGEGMTVEMAPTDGKARYINGAVVEFKHTGLVNRYYRYRATLRPWLWFLTLNANCRIFQDKSIPDIIKAVFAGYSFAEVEYHLEDHPVLTYCVQYRESDFNFVSRLMEHEGIFYYFKHIKGKHTLVITDSGNHYQHIDGYQNIPYFPPENDANRERDHIYEWLNSQQVCTGKFEHNDYNFEMPTADLTTKAELLSKSSHNAMEVYDFPGKYNQAQDGSKLSDKRIEELHGHGRLVHGAGNALGLQTGLEFTLKGFYFDAENVKHIVISASYEIGGGGGYVSGNENEGQIFSCNFVAINAKQSFRSLRSTQKPVISGSQTAVVVGKDGEEIWTDKYGRIKVKFPWDRDPEKHEKSSCWIRVSYPSAGKNWGGISLPRMGQEVIVSFLHGDPDQPMITGRVYNAVQMPPYALPANMTQSGMKSRSSKGGTPDNFNEFRFEDKKGSEFVFLHAEKDQSIEVEHDEAHWVGHDRTKTIDHDEISHIKHNRTETVDENETITIVKNRSEDVGVNETISIGKNRSETVGENESLEVGKNRERNVGENETITIGKKHTIDVGDTRQTTIGKDDMSNVSKKFVLDAGDEITLKSGDASITLKKDGTIQIKGKDITISGSGQVGVKASSDLVLKGSKIAGN